MYEFNSRLYYDEMVDDGVTYDSSSRNVESGSVTKVRVIEPGTFLLEKDFWRPSESSSRSALEVFTMTSPTGFCTICMKQNSEELFGVVGAHRLITSGKVNCIHLSNALFAEAASDTRYMNFARGWAR